MRRLTIAAAAAIALAGAAEARPPAGDDAARGAAPQRAGKAAVHQAAERRAGQRRRSRRAKLVRRGRVGSVIAGLPRGFEAAPLLLPASTGGSTPGSSTQADPGAPPPPPPPPAPPAGSGRSVQARTDDRDPDHLRLILSRTTVLAGDVKVEFNNGFAEDPHDLLVERAGGSGASYAFPELGPGEVERLTLALDAGQWSLRCTIPTHAERGMTAALTVTG